MSNPVPRLRRLLSIIPLIRRRGGISLAELQRTLGVSKRELQGDLNAILLCGVPPYLPNDYISVNIEGDHVTVDFADHFARPARLTLQEALALRLAIARLQIPEDGPLYDAYIELLEALDALVLGEDMASLEGRIDSSKSVDTSDKLGALDAAIAERRPVEFSYYSRSSEQVRRRRVRPYGRSDKQGNTYLVGHCEAAGETRSFRLDRISDLSLVEDGERFEVPAGFDVHQYVAEIGAGHTWHVRVKFDPGEAARFAGDDYAEARHEQGPDGSLVVSHSCHSLPWAVSKALTYGETAEVLEPAQARAEVVARLEAFLGADGSR